MNDGVIINDAGKHDVNSFVAWEGLRPWKRSRRGSRLPADRADWRAGPAQGHLGIHGIRPLVETEN
jgi:hypothetical protein